MIKRTDILYKALLSCFMILFFCSSFAEKKDFNSTVKRLSSELSEINQQLLIAAQNNSDNVNGDLKMNNVSVKENPLDTYKTLMTVQEEQTLKMQSKEPVNAFDSVFEWAIKRMISMKNEYKNDPYIIIKGFDITLGVSPSVTVSLEFKPESSAAAPTSKK
jgi:hypothetical protein